MRGPRRRDDREALRGSLDHQIQPVWRESYSVGEECDAFLRGEYLDWCLHAELPIHPWMHLNRVAHSSWDALDVDGSSWSNSRVPRTWADVGRLVEDLIVLEVRPSELVELQTDLLVPLELEVCKQPCTPRQVYALAVHGIL